jgi:hypothetical protein
MSKDSINVQCVRCGLMSRRPAAFVRARRSFICGGCKEMIPLDERSILDRAHVRPRGLASPSPVAGSLMPAMERRHAAEDFITNRRGG